MGEWWESREGRWLRRHAVFAPFGIFVMTALMTYFTGTVGANTREFWKSAADMVDLGTVLYAMAAMSFEKGVDAVFWALEQRRKRRERYEAEAKAAAESELISALVAAGQEQGNQEVVALVESFAKERGISLDEPPRR